MKQKGNVLNLMHMEAQGHDDSDSRLVEETRAGSERAFREIVERHHGRIYYDTGKSGGNVFAFTVPVCEESHEG